MYNREKIIKLKLTAIGSICTENGFGNCECDDCEECSIKYQEEHIEAIQKNGCFDCADCDYTKKAMGLEDEVKCSDCDKKIKEYLKEDFKTIFNKLTKEVDNETNSNDRND